MLIARQRLTHSTSNFIIKAHCRRLKTAVTSNSPFHFANFSDFRYNTLIPSTVFESNTNTSPKNISGIIRKARNRTPRHKCPQQSLNIKANGEELEAGRVFPLSEVIGRRAGLGVISSASVANVNYMERKYEVDLIQAQRWSK